MRGKTRGASLATISSVRRGRERDAAHSSQSFSANLPSACSTVVRMPRCGSSVGSTTAAAAPSPKITATSRPRVVMSMPVECTSPPTTSTQLKRPDLMKAFAVASE